MEIILGIIFLLTFFSIEGHLRKINQTNKEIVELLKEINEKY